MKYSRKYSNDNDDVLEEGFETTEEAPILVEDSGYIVVRRITYGKKPVVKIPVGAQVPIELVKNTKIFTNLLSKGAIVKRGD
jgi:hypothetical protein